MDEQSLYVEGSHVNMSRTLVGPQTRDSSLISDRLDNIARFRSSKDGRQYVADTRITNRKHFDDEIIRPTQALNQFNPSPVRQNGSFFDSETVAAATTLGGIAAAAPALLPAVGVAAVGYGVYKLGHTFDLW